MRSAAGRVSASLAIFFGWKKKYAWLPPSDMRRLRELVDGMPLDWSEPIRRACRVLPFDTSNYHYQPRRTDPTFLKNRIKKICETHVRHGYRRVYHILRREGWVVNAKKIYRLYRTLSLQLRNKKPKPRVKAKLREDSAPAGLAKDVQAMDCAHDQLAISRKPLILTVVDTHCRLSQVVDYQFSYRSEEVVATLEGVCRKMGYHKIIRTDNGSEFFSRDLDL